MSKGQGFKQQSLATARLKQARAYILANPTMTKSQIVLLTGLSDSTIARARRDLVTEGLLQASRNAPVQEPTPDTIAGQPEEAAENTPAPETTVKRPVKGGTSILDHAAMMQLAEMIDTAVESGDDAYIQKMLIKQCLVFALRTDLHPDTRMTASQMWGKLRDMARAKDLGPGKPKTRADAVLRTRDMLIAVGPEITVEAVRLAFDVKESTDGQTANDEALSSSGPPQAPGPAGHASDPAPTEVVRPIDVGVRGQGDTDQGMENPNLPGPSTGREGEASPPRTTTHPHGDSPWD